jgi:tetratricopeptide (TPR) repeat protein
MDKAGVSDAQAVLEESTHHDTDGDGRLDQEELERAASVVAAQQQVQEAMVDAEPEPQVEPAIEVEAPVVEPAEDSLEDVIAQAKEELDAGHPKAAIGLLRDRLRTDGAEHVEAWLTAATAMHRLNLEDHALGAAQHSLRLDDQRPEGWALVGDVHAAKGEHNAAIEAYTNAIERGAGEEVANRRWPLLTRSEHPELWFEEGMTRLGPEAEEDDRTALAGWLLDLGEGEVGALEHLPDQPPTLPEAPDLGARVLLLLANDAPRLRARAHSLQLQHLEAIGLWKAEVTNDGDDATAWLGMARALEAAGELEKAAKCHARAQQLSGEAEQDTMETVAPTPSVPAEFDADPAPEFPAPDEPAGEDVESAASILLTPAPSLSAKASPEAERNPEVDLAAAALEATSNMAAPTRTTTPEQDAQQGREWFNRGTQLLEDKKFREALSCFDKSLSLLADDEEKVILVLNARGNCYYYMEDYPKCVDAYYQAMMIRPAQVRGQTLYNMGVAYAEMERYDDAIKCFEQGESRGLTPDEVALAKEQIRRCKILRKEKEKRAARRR